MIYKDRVFPEDEFTGEQFSDCRFMHCSFPGGDLKFTLFVNCAFVECDLSAARCDGTSFSGCSFPESKLSGLNFSSTKFKDCDFSRTILNDCLFETSSGRVPLQTKQLKLATCTFRDTDLRRSTFILCDLSGVDLSGSDLTEATFERCELRRANFGNTDLSGIRFIGCWTDRTILDLQGFLAYGHANGFILESEQDPLPSHSNRPSSPDTRA